MLFQASMQLKLSRSGIKKLQKCPAMFHSKSWSMHDGTKRPFIHKILSEKDASKSNNLSFTPTTQKGV